ncbi:endonuclease/exonuclease/phosphatase family protein [Actinomycetospora chibensis]|uniref:endonuclease/exonuclease/phosphatase family protein n=1 Tax=Actinomycetospora chibensis TaxID=663606 RepID=UPI0023659EB8|nr:endonuclease/exonuclease/phosphatase family protein [Actinomycetospora chibensis]MDD7923618.1 endonuclease/exonuclease/phosphatase family protein [Actinomycetospora chibensis]
MTRWPAGLATGAAAATALLVPEALGMERRPPWPVLLAARPAFAGGLGVVAGVLAARSSRARPAALGAAGVAGFVLAAGRRPGATSAGPVTLTVLVANVWQGRADPEALAAIVETERPDLVVLPESGERFRARLEDRLKPDLGYVAHCAPPPRPHRHVPEHPDGPWTTVLTAPSLGDVRVARLVSGGLYGWLEVTGGELGAARVLATHTVAPVPGLVDRWADELDLVAAWRAAAPGPTVVAGDLNTTVEHRALAALGDGGVPGPPTWPRRWPRWLGFRIDHVLAGGGLAVRTARVLDLPGSDHRAVLAHLG